MIAFCHLLNDHSGSPIVLNEIITALQDGDQENRLFVGSQGRGALVDAPAKISRYWYRRSRFRPVTLITFLFSQISLYRALSKAKLPADTIVYINTLLPFGAALWAKRNRKRVVYHVHEVSLTPKLLQQFLVWIVQNTADLAIYVSEENRRLLPIAGVPSAIVANSIPERIAARGFASQYKPRRTGAFQILMLASPRDYKGVPEFMQLASSLAQHEDLTFKLVLNGDDDEVAQYMSKFPDIAALQYLSRIREPEALYAQADVLLNLSRVDLWVETFGLTIVEAMAFGVPVICPPIGGPVEIVEHGKEGFHVDSRESERLRECVLSLANDPDLAMRMSQASKRRAGGFTVESFAQDLKRQLATLPEIRP